jgi:multiple sugar transport system ATP-binding protein
VIMNSGRIEQIGTPEEVYVRPASRYVARFIGNPQMDFLAGDIVSQGDGATAIKVGGASFALPAGAHAALGAARAIDLGVRPEHINLQGQGIPASVTIVQPVGPFTFVTFAWDGGQLTARVPGMASRAPGEILHFTVEPQHLLLFDRATGSRIALARPS